MIRYNKDGDLVRDASCEPSHNNIRNSLIESVLSSYKDEISNEYFGGMPLEEVRKVLQKAQPELFI